MKQRITPLSAVLLLSALVFPSKTVLGICVPFCPDCNLTNSGQLNFVVFDRDRELTRLIPNIRIVGEAEDFALVVPTPRLPALNEAPQNIWWDAALLTAPVNRFPISDDTGCGTTRSVDVATAPPEDDVVIHSQETVGAFIATILSSKVPNALLMWLEDNGYPVTTRQAELLTELAEDGWFFTAMKLDGVPMPAPGWDTSVDPVEFAWSGTDFEIPIGLLSIRSAATLPVTFYVVDTHRATIEGFQTSYANRLTESEYRAIQERYPTLRAFVEPGLFITRLDHTFQTGDNREGRRPIERASNDDEFRQGVADAGLPQSLLGLGLLAVCLQASGWADRRRRSRSRQAPGDSHDGGSASDH